MPVTQEHIDTITRDVAAIAPKIEALTAKANTELAALRSELDTVKKADKTDPLFVNKVDTLAASVETMQASLEAGKAVSARVDAVEAVLKRPGFSTSETEDKDAKAAFEWHKAKMVKEGKFYTDTKIEPDTEAYGKYCDAIESLYRVRGDNPSFTLQASLQTGNDPDGGYLVPSTTSDRIITKVYETSPIRQYATVVSIAGKEITFPRDEGEVGYGFIGETTAPTETTTSQFGESKIAVHEMFAEPRVTQTMVEDAAFDVGVWIQNKVAERFARVEADKFLNGTGVNQPRGLLTYAAGTTNGTIEQVNSGAAAAVTTDGLYNLVYSLKDFYTANARFMMKRTTVRDILKLKDGNGQYMWQMGDIKSGQPATLLSYPVVRAEDMPVVEAGALAIIFGDIAKAYTVVDRLGINMIRDALTSKPFVKFYHRRRFGGDVLNFEAVKLQKISA